MSTIEVTVEPPAFRGGSRIISGLMPDGRRFAGGEAHGTVAFTDAEGTLLADGRGVEEAAMMLSENERTPVRVVIAPSKAHPNGRRFTVDASVLVS